MATNTETLHAVGAIEQIAKHKNNRYGIKIGGIWFNGFGDAPGQIGEVIDFDYAETPKDDGSGETWKNIRFINNIFQTGQEPNEPDFKAASELKNNDMWHTQTMENDEKNRKAMIMKASVDLCLARKTLSEEEIRAQYKRLMEAME